MPALKRCLGHYGPTALWWLAVLHSKVNLVKMTKIHFCCARRLLPDSREQLRAFDETVIHMIKISKEEPLCDFAFGVDGWDRAYTAAVERLAFEAAARCTHSYDPLTYFDAVSASIGHPNAKSAIVREFLKSARDLINALLEGVDERFCGLVSFGEGPDADRRRGLCADVSKVKSLAPEGQSIEGSKFDQHSHPPSSKLTRLTVEADCCIRSCPTRVEPVNESLRTG
jgi:hypothetical protein